MSALSLLGSGAMMALTVALCLMLSGQVLHVFFLHTRTRSSRGMWSVAFQVALAVSMGVWAWVADSAGPGGGHRTFWLLGHVLSTDSLEWVIAGGALVGIGSLAMRPQWGTLFETVGLILMTPPVLAAAGTFGAGWALAVILGVWGGYAIRGVVVLFRDREQARHSTSRLLVSEVVAKMPAGVLVAETSGAVRLMNDAMREQLRWLGLPGDLGDGQGSRASMASASVAPSSSSPSPPKTQGDSPERVVQIGSGEYRLFSERTVPLEGQRVRMVLSVDVTEEQQVNEQMQHVNEALTVAGAELQERLKTLDIVAREESLAKVRSRVHDIIGQRLSILHRYLEDGAAPGVKMGVITSLLSGLMDDLVQDRNVGQDEELEGIISAFSLVNVRSEMEGSLPGEEVVAAAFVGIVREAITNAVRHGQAEHVHVRMTDDDGVWQLRIENNGVPPREVPGEGGREGEGGTGIGAMRDLVTSLGGRLEIPSLDPFVLAVEVPKQ